jgi:hypothetical protein
MVFDKALGALTTIAGINTLPVDTGLSIRTIIIACTARGIGQLYRPTARVLDIGDPTLATGADHSAEGKAVDHTAARGHVARRQAEAGVLAALVETGRVVRTVGIHPTLRVRIRGDGLLLGRAGDQRVADPARRAGALGIVVEDGAGGAGRAGVLIQAGVEAALPDTGRVLGTVGVDAALDPEALLVGVAL